MRRRSHSVSVGMCIEKVNFQNNRFLFFKNRKHVSKYMFLIQIRCLQQLPGQYKSCQFCTYANEASGDDSALRLQLLHAKNTDYTRFKAKSDPSQIMGIRILMCHKPLRQRLEAGATAQKLQVERHVHM